MMIYVGKVAEYLVLAELLRRDMEAYPAISFRQEGYDLTVIREDKTIVRVQVKATELQNKSTNNAVGKLNKKYDFLVLVVFDGDEPQFFILSKNEVIEAWGKKPGTLYTSEYEKNRYVVRAYLKAHKGKWKKIVSSKPDAAGK